MRVGWVIPCRYVEVNGNLATIVGGNIDRVWVPGIPPPEPIQLLCAVRIIATHDEVPDEPAEEPSNKLSCRVYGPAMNLVSELDGTFGFGGTFDPTIEPAIVLPIGVVFLPEEEGQHTIEIAIDDRGQSVPFTVIAGAPPTP